MKNTMSLWKKIRAVLVILYAVLLFILIPFFFWNYNGEWIKKVADSLPLKERTVGDN